MFYYKKDNQIYSFPDALNQTEYDEFIAGTRTGTLVGDYFTSPYGYCRRSDNTFWGLEIELSDNEVELFHTGTLSFSRDEVLVEQIGVETVDEVEVPIYSYTPITVVYNAVFLSYPIEHPPVPNVPDWARVQQRLYRTMAFVKALNSPSLKFSFVSDCILSGKEDNSSVFESTFRDGILALKGDLVGTAFEFDQSNIDEINTALSLSGFSIQITL